MKVKTLKEPKKPFCPGKPRPPSKIITGAVKSVSIKKDFLYTSDHQISWTDFTNARAGIQVEDDKLRVIIRASNNSYDDDDANIDSVQFEWDEDIDNPNYERELKLHKENLKKYELKREKYVQDMSEYNIKMAEFLAHKEEADLAELRARKELIEKRIARQEAKLAKK